MISESLQQRIALGISIVFGILLFYTFAHMLWQWRSDWVLTHQTITSSTKPLEKDQTTAMIATLPQAHLFGRNLNTNATGDLPITSLQLHVTGIIKVENSAASKVMISIAGQPSKIYRVGDSLPSGVKIDAITHDAVILENGGNLEKLPLPRKKIERSI